ncbi:MAG: extracellular solute-binding protein, partial [Clostridiales bacterium]|nr:extracellular solute-binding protein [Clostridiales bacterium]
ELVNGFNRTVGAENGVIVKVTSVADANVISEQLLAAVDRDPGAPGLPDMAVVGPMTAVTLAEKGVLVDLGDYLPVDELDSYVPQFIDEGRLGGDSLFLMPVAKSTEVLYLNRTLFDRFSSETGVGLDKLSTFEGIAEAAAMYYGWSGGKMFYYPEGLFNQAMIGFQQMGSDIVKGEMLNVRDPGYKRVWDFYYDSAVKGGTAIYDGWGNYLAATGDIVCATASSAGATYYPSRITYADNTKEDVEFDVLPYPVFEGGEKVVYQRGGGICVIGDEPAKGYAAGLFLGWLTEAEQNLGFCVSTGYMPVRKAAFDEIMAGNHPVIENPIAEKSLIATAEMQKSYRFYYPPVFDGFETLQAQYAERLRQAAQDGRDNYLRLMQEGQAPEEGAAAIQGPAHEPNVQAKLPDIEPEARSSDALEYFINSFDP